MLKIYKLLTALTILILALSVTSAFPLSVPTNVEVFNEATVLVDITNNSLEQKALSINLFVPSTTTIYAPSSISPNETVTAKIIIKNNFSNYTEISSKLEVYLGTDLEERELSIKFYGGNAPADLSGLFGIFLGSFAGAESLFGETIAFTPLEWTVLFVLVLVAVVLLIAFVARVARGV